MQRREFLRQSGAALAAASIVRPLPALPASMQKPLNLLFLTVDDMNHSLPGFMGGKYHLTPRLDALAAVSHRFIRNRTTAPICQPSREAMMTGLTPHHSGALGFNPVNDGTPSLTTVLKANGYYTAGIHKLEHMMPESSFPWDYKVPGTDRNPRVYVDGVSHAIAQAAEQKRPFFINCNLNDPHRPFYGSELAAAIDRADTGDYKISRPLSAEDVQAPSVLENIAAVREEFAQYCNSAQRMDGTIGKVLDVLHASPEAENTVVLFTADHGMPFPFSKGTVYDNGTRTPVLLSWPGMGKPRTFEDLTCNIDILPTLCDLLAVAAPDSLDGHSWLPLIHGTHSIDREYVVTHVNTLNSGMAFPMRAVQNRRYSLVFSPWADGELTWRGDAFTGLTYKAMAKAAETDARIAERMKQCVLGIPLAFYDLQIDPDQRIDRLGAADCRKEVAAMKQYLLAYMESSNDPQLGNFKALLAGGKPKVIQPPKQRGRPD